MLIRVFRLQQLTQRFSRSAATAEEGVETLRLAEELQDASEDALSDTPAGPRLLE